MEKRNLKNLALAILSFVISFYLFGIRFEFLPDTPNAFSVFLAAIALCVLSIALILSTISLNLHRTIYLVSGIAFVFLTFMAASPMVRRHDNIALSARAQNSFFQAIIISHSTFTIGNKQLAETIDVAIKPSVDHLTEVLEEPPFYILLLALAQLGIACGIGLWIGKGIDEITHLLPIALVATVADIWSVSAGATAQIIVSSSINYFLLRFPVISTGSIPYLIGLTDFLFYAIFLQAAIKFKLGTVKNTIVLFLSFIPAVAGALFFQTGLPVLPFMALFFVIANWKNLSIKKEEVKTIVGFIIGILIIFTLVSFAIN